MREERQIRGRKEKRHWEWDIKISSTVITDEILLNIGSSS